MAEPGLSALRPRRRRLALGLLLLIALAAGASLLLLLGAIEMPQREQTTYAVAEAYLAAVRKGDKEAALSLYRGDALCSAPFPYPSEVMDEHIALLASSKVRNVSIWVETAQGVAYTPGSERAVVRFEVLVERTWKRGTIWLVTGPLGDDGKRYICHLA